MTSTFDRNYKVEMLEGGKSFSYQDFCLKMCSDQDTDSITRTVGVWVVEELVVSRHDLSNILEIGLTSIQPYFSYEVIDTVGLSSVSKGADIEKGVMD